MNPYRKSLEISLPEGDIFSSSILEPAQAINQTTLTSKNFWKFYASAIPIDPVSGLKVSVTPKRPNLYFTKTESLSSEYADFMNETFNDRNVAHNRGILELKNQEGPFYDPLLDVHGSSLDRFEIDNRFNPQKKIGYAISKASHKSLWSRQDNIEQTFTKFLKISSAVSDTLDFYIQRNEILKQLNVVKEWKDSWTEYGLERPSDLTIVHAESVMEMLLNLVISNDYRWLTPFISGDGNANITSIWYQGKRELHLKIGENDIEYFRVSGININTEMEVNSLEFDAFLRLWKWLVNE